MLRIKIKPKPKRRTKTRWTQEFKLAAVARIDGKMNVATLGSSSHFATETLAQPLLR